MTPAFASTGHTELFGTTTQHVAFLSHVAGKNVLMITISLADLLVVAVLVLPMLHEPCPLALLLAHTRTARLGICRGHNRGCVFGRGSQE